jgi:hypothetical protein
MTTHVGVMILFALCLSAVFAALLRDDSRDQLFMGGRIFGGLVVSAYLVGWLMLGLFG